MADLNQTFQKVQLASRKLLLLDPSELDEALENLAGLVLDHIAEILEANALDLEKFDPNNPMYDRLLLTEARIRGIAQEIRQVSKLPSPLNLTLESKILDNGLSLTKTSVPMGVIGVIYEARPNVTFDVFALALKSGNGLLLKGGSDAAYSNQKIMEIIHRSLAETRIPEDAFQLLPSDREATKALLEAVGYVDILIPRGSQGLIDFVRQNAKVPVIETGAGIVHTYVDATADIAQSAKIIYNAKTRRPSVCNSLDCLLIHTDRLGDLPYLLDPLKEKNVTIYADESAYASLQGKYAEDLLLPAEPSHFGTEFLSLKLAVKTVSDLDDAMNHIAQFSSKHSEAILSTDEKSIDIFLKSVDAAAVYANASTAFTDGNQFGLGAEIGISTQKLHARGPMALRELTSYKWVIKGKGQIRE
jgi:glutamate-5-semialdehyde dehydrogenase